MQDTAVVYTQGADLGAYEAVDDYIIELITPDFVDITTYKLNKPQQAILDSCLLYQKPVTLYAKYRLLSQLKPKPEYYNRLKEIADTEINAVAVLALAPLSHS